MAVSTIEMLIKALLGGENAIELEVGIGDKVIKIKGAGAVTWVVAFGAVGILGYLAIKHGGSNAVTEAVAENPAKSAMAGFVGVATAAVGPAAATLAASMVASTGGVGILYKLRKYDAKKLDNGNVLLTKRV